jgi:hypothetical protein
VRKIIPNSYWVIIGVICLSGVVLVVLGFLLAFHCYLSCYLGFTTLDYIYHDTENIENGGKNNREERPLSERYLY